jgi:diguanylate cyclase (GGDEF)-like protein
LGERNVDVILLDPASSSDGTMPVLHEIHRAQPGAALLLLAEPETEALHPAVVQAVLPKTGIEPQWLALVLELSVVLKESEANLSETEKHYQAMPLMFDPLTGLPTRELIMDRLAHSLLIAQRTRRKVAVFMIDLDYLQEINNNLGREQGDKALRIIAQRIQGSLRQSDSVGRLGDDEFAVILEGIQSTNFCDIVARKLLREISRPLAICDEACFLTASIGVAVFPDLGKDTETLLKRAEAAMRQAKERRNTYTYYWDDKDNG